MRFFFEDHCDYQKAPEAFIIKIMVSLDSTLFNEGDLIVENGEIMEEIFFINHGRAEIIGTFTKDEEEDVKVSVVELKEGSWFGDY